AILLPQVIRHSLRSVEEWWLGIGFTRQTLSKQECGFDGGGFGFSDTLDQKKLVERSLGQTIETGVLLEQCLRRRFASQIRKKFQVVDMLQSIHWPPVPSPMRMITLDQLLRNSGSQKPEADKFPKCFAWLGEEAAEISPGLLSGLL